MDKEKFEAVLNYFEDQNIQLPTDVKNSIEDVFLENDDIEGVECYHKGDLKDFQKDLTLTNFVKMSLSGSNSGETYNVFTYYGNLTYSLSEAIILTDENDEIIEEISKLENHENTILETPNEYVVVLLERVNWDSEEKNLIRNPILYLYCPVALEDDNIYDQPYEDDLGSIYSKMGLKMED